VSVSILGQTVLSTPGGGGPSFYSPLVPGPNPADQDLPRSTTSTTVTFSAPSGGSGSYSYSAALTHVVGTGATLSGSGLGPYTVSGLQPDDVVEVTLTITDTGPTTQVVYKYCVISVQGGYLPLQAPGAPADQNLAATATSSSPASFTAATGGSGAYSYAATLTQTVGTGATLSGSGLGPYTVNALEFGDVVEVALTATDTGPIAQSITSTFIVSVVQLSSVVTVAANPASQSLPVGSTTGGPFTFTGPSGGSGAFAQTGTLVQDVGSGASLTGSGLGPYNISGLSNGSIATVVVTSADTAGLGQEVQNFATTAVVASYAVLNPAGAPANQSLPAGTTTSGSFSFTAATGGSGAYSYGVVLSAVRGSGASLTGSGLGPFTVSGLEDNDIFVVTMTTGDTGPVAQSVTSRTYILVARAPLVPGASAGNETLPIGSTTNTPFTFNAPTGGSGSYSYSVALAQVTGSGASLTGSGLGPYTVSGLADGSIVRVTLTVTDTTTNQQVFNTATIAVLQAGTYTPLVAGADPAAQILAAGTTSTAVTFTAPTGGTGLYAYSVTLDQTLGVGASVSGSGLGPYTVSGLSDGSAAKITLTATDLGLVGQTTTAICQIGVLTSATSGAWTPILDQDMTAVDPIASFFSGSQPITIGGVPWSTLTATRTGSTNGATSIDASGLFIGGTSGIGQINVALDLATPAGLNDAAMQLGSVVVQFQAQSIVLAGSNNYVSWGISVGNTFSDPVSVRKLYQISGGYNILTQRAATTVETLSGVGTFTEMVTSIVIIAGRLIFAKTDLGTTVMPDGYPDLSGYTYLGIAAESATTAQAYGNVLKGFFLLRCATAVSNYITRIRVLKWS
jgi:hypothetical protein